MGHTWNRGQLRGLGRKAVKLLEGGGGAQQPCCPLQPPRSLKNVASLKGAHDALLPVFLLICTFVSNCGVKDTYANQFINIPISVTHLPGDSDALSPRGPGTGIFNKMRW